LPQIDEIIELIVIIVVLILEIFFARLGITDVLTGFIGFLVFQTKVREKKLITT